MAKVKSPPTPTEQDFNKALADHLQAHNREAMLTAKLNAEIAKANAKYATELQQLKDKKAETTDIAERYCKANEKTLFVGVKKSYETSYGTVGFRTGKAAVELCEGKSWDEVVAELKKRSSLKIYLRTKEELDKTAVLRDRDVPALQKRLDGLGISIKQGETFFITPKAA